MDTAPPPHDADATSQAVRRTLALILDTVVPGGIGVAAGWLYFTAAVGPDRDGWEALGAAIIALLVAGAVYLAAAVVVDLWPLGTGRTPGERITGVPARAVTLGSALLRFVLRQVLVVVAAASFGGVTDVLGDEAIGSGLAAGVVLALYAAVGATDLLDRSSLVRRTSSSSVAGPPPPR